MGEIKNGYSILFWEPKWKRHLGRPRSRWDYNIRMDLKEIRWAVVDWIHLAQDRDKSQALVNMLMNLRVP
jgi:hypothetical protein